MNHPENVKACVLLNSHFNHNTQMPYLCVSMHKNQTTGICVFLLIWMNNYHAKKCFKTGKSLCLTKWKTKYSIFYIGTHFSMFTHKEQINRVSDRI